MGAPIYWIWGKMARLPVGRKTQSNNLEPILTQSALKKFMVFFNIPLATMTEWQKTDPQQRAASENDMMVQWQKWSAENASTILSTEIGGKTKNVLATGITDTRNDIVVFSVVQGASHDAVASLYLSHPHLQIPNASIQIMEVKPMGSM